MPRAQRGAARRQSKNRWFAKARGMRGSRSRNWRRVKQAVVRAGRMQTEHRQVRKRDYRRLWITRVSAAVRQRGMSYSRFIAGLKHANVSLNRKMLSQLAIEDPPAFDQVVEKAREGLESRT